MDEILQDKNKLKNHFANIYRIELLFNDKNEKPDIVDILSKLSRELGNVEILSDTGLKTIAFRDYSTKYDKGELPAQIMYSDYVEFDIDKISEMTKSQSWDCKNIDDMLEECNYKIILSDFMSGKLEYKERCSLIITFLNVLLKFYPNCIAIYWPHSEKIIPIDVYKDNPYEGKSVFLHGGINVRFFNINDDKSMLIDTIGLGSIGLTDFQCHFKNIDPNRLISQIYNLCSYVFENGNIIEDGDSVAGIDPGDKWLCQYEEALVQPYRTVIDINVGENAAGER